MLVFAAIGLLVATAEPGSADVLYTGPKTRKNAGLDAFSFSQFEVGQRAFSAVDGTNLREKADAASASLAVLPLATPVQILEPIGARARVGERVDQWYRVQVDGKTGFIFGGSLTFAAFVSNLDADFEPERLAVAWSPNYKIRVRLLDDGNVQQLDLEPGGQAYACCGGLLQVSLVEAATAGLPLVRIRSSVEACGDYLVVLVSYRSGKLHKALEAAGLADPPSYAEPSIAFDAQAKTAMVTTKSWAVDEEGNRADESTSVAHYGLDGGVYVKQPSTPSVTPTE